MIARVSLEIALRKEFDYLIPPGLAGQIEVGSRVQVPFGPRKVLGVVTALAEESAHANLKPVLKVIGAQTLVTPKVLKLARWIAEYYCCAPEIALKSVLPEAVRKEESGWRERLFVRALPTGRRISKTAQTPAGGLEPHRGTARAAVAGIDRTGRNHRRHRPQTGRPRPGGNCPADFRARSLRPRAHPAVAATGFESGAGKGLAENHEAMDKRS